MFKTVILEKKYFFILLAVHLFFFAFWSPYVGSDGLAFYAWVYSPIVHKDLDFSSGELPLFIPATVKTETGLSHNPQNAGSSLMNAPFLLIAYLVSLITEYTEEEFQNPSIFTAAYNFGTVVYSFFGSWILFQVLTNLKFKKSDSMLAILIIILATPLIHYIFHEPSYSHTQTFFAVSLLLFIWVKFGHENSIKYWICMGLCVGLIFLIRLVDIVFIIFPILALILFQWKDLKLPKTYFRILLYLGFVVLAFSPMMIFWQIVYGELIPTPLPVEQLFTQMGEPDKKFMDWGNPHFMEFLFSEYRGLFLWHPVFILLLIGYFFLFKKHKKLAIISVIMTALIFYVHSAPFDWMAGGAFGQRRIADIIPFLSLGLVALLDYFKVGSLKSKILKPIIFISTIFYNILFMSLWSTEKLIRRTSISFIDDVLVNYVNSLTYLEHTIVWGRVLRHLAFSSREYGLNLDQLGWFVIFTILTIIILLFAFKSEIRLLIKNKG